MADRMAPVVCPMFNSKLRDEVLNEEIFYSMKELRVPAER
jgi:putative transposase